MKTKVKALEVVTILLMGVLAVGILGASWFLWGVFIRYHAGC